MRRLILALAIQGLAISIKSAAAEEPSNATSPPTGSDKPGSASRTQLQIREGGIVRGPSSSRKMALVFTGHEYAESGNVLLDELGRHRGKGSFFFTGDFLVNPCFQPLIKRIRLEGHYLGPHSDKHLLYCPWQGEKRTLVTPDEFRSDLEANLEKIEKLGLRRSDVNYFLPPFEHYNVQIAEWTAEAGLRLVNFTPGTRSHADYTGERDTNFVSSAEILASILKKEQEDPDGLNGFILLLHIGAGPGRSDKFHTHFGRLLGLLDAKGYQFVRVDELLRGR